MNTAYAYLRVSGLSQVDGEGLDRQEEACVNYAVAQGLTIVRIYREEGVCGVNDLEGRPALRTLLEDAGRDSVSLVLVEKLDRLARDLMVQESIILDMRRHEIQLTSVAEPDLCSTDPTRTMMRQILGAFYEYERKMIVARLRDARERIKAREGRCEGAKPFGHHRDEHEALTVILQFQQQGLNLSQIASRLNSLGVPSRYKRRWFAGTIRRILRRHKITQ